MGCMVSFRLALSPGWIVVIFIFFRTFPLFPAHFRTFPLFPADFALAGPFS
jgi:hypothetical protein